MEKVIALDVDGVLADFVWGFTALGKQYFGEQVKITKTPEHATWDEFPGMAAIHGETVWKHIRGSMNFWRMLEPCVPEYIFGSLAQLADQHQVYFITNRMGYRAKQQTEGWLCDHGIVNPTVMLSAGKGVACKAIGATAYIDDKAGNAVYAKYENRNTHVYLLDRLYNRFDQSVVGTKVKRIDSVENFLKEVVCG